MAVCERIILANLAKDVGLPNMCGYERLFELESFFLDSIWDINLWVRFVSR